MIGLVEMSVAFRAQQARRKNRRLNRVRRTRWSRPGNACAD